MTLEDAADHLAIRELVDAYAHCADRRDGEGQMALFTEDARFLVFMDAKASAPSQTITRRADLKPVFDDLRQYETTTHFNGKHRRPERRRRHRRKLLPGPPRPGSRRASQPDGRLDPLSGQLHQTGWALAVRRAAIDGRLDRNPPALNPGAQILESSRAGGS